MTGGEGGDWFDGVVGGVRGDEGNSSRGHVTLICQNVSTCAGLTGSSSDNPGATRHPVPFQIENGMICEQQRSFFHFGAGDRLAEGKSGRTALP
ncbi:hypothetical protein GWI33_019153 [Rhynchophorus ferrugineus]|uniref:Uncharacterized protein n=1 Tax=Rhynchophorus ferrugineus TaxID=354439 RepID=A0A834HSB9_RHYFE|nr:hypothetical protein GWI33_019153 [Rhynchophorus ferrugineus]